MATPAPTDASSGLFLRQGSRVQGPFPRARIRELALSGELKPDMDVSADRVGWQRASDIPGLFAPSAAGNVGAGEHEAESGSAAPPAKKRSMGVVLRILVGVVGLVVVAWQFLGNTVPSEVKMAAEYAEREQALLEPLKPLLAQVDAGALDAQQRQAFADQLRTEFLPKFEALRPLIREADGSNAVVQAVERVLDARLDSLRSLAGALVNGYPQSLEALREKTEAVRRALSGLWQAFPSKHRTPINPHEPPPLLAPR